MKKIFFALIFILILFSAVTAYCSEWYDNTLRIYGIELPDGFSDYEITIKEFGDIIGVDKNEIQKITLKIASDMMCETLPDDMLYYTSSVDNLYALGVVVGDENGIDINRKVTYVQALIMKNRLDMIKSQLSVITNNIFICDDGNKITYISPYKSGSIYRCVNGETERISADKWARSLNYNDGILTYINGDTIKTLNVETMESKTYESGIDSEIVCKNDNVYYAVDDAIMCYNLKTGLKTPVSAKPCHTFSFRLGTAYGYIYYENDYKLYRCTADGSVSEFVADLDYECFCISEDKIYYLNNGNIYTIDLSLKNCECIYVSSDISLAAFHNIFVYNDLLYADTGDVLDNSNIYSINMKNQEIKCVAACYSGFGISLGQFIYDTYDYDGFRIMVEEAD